MPGHKIDFPISCTAMSSRCHDDDDDEYDYDGDADDDGDDDDKKGREGLWAAQWPTFSLLEW